ncbi:MAG: hypothetical protein EAX90_05920 [Candidatus Heimdallarchaeota archaeon]|nr:hypothetical protein [Candidatus Heimdallarchaeota archaeon]
MLIEKTKFGSIVIDGKTYTSDLYINIDGSIEKRKKELSRPYSKGHTVLGPDELNYLLNQKPDTLIIGKGQFGKLPIPKISRDLIEQSKVIVIEDKLPVVIHMINDLVKQKAKLVAILHITC